MTRLALLLALLWGGVATVASHAGESYSHPLPQFASTPAWLKIRQPDPAAGSTFASWEFAVQPPEGSGDLAVTFCFDEKDGGFLKVYWQGTTEAITLCDNLYDGVGMPNQKTLLIPKSVLGAGGTLTALAGTSDAGITRVDWNWVTKATVAVTDASSAPALLRAGNQALRAEDISGNAPEPLSDRIQGNAVSAILQDEPVRIEQGVDFVASLEEVPPLARIEVQLLGVPLDRTIALWINGQLVNPLALETPDLLTPGYSPAIGQNGQPSYTGWRKGTLFIPSSALRVGENHFHFALLDSTSALSGTPPMALKNFTLQLNFDSAASTSAATNQP